MYHLKMLLLLFIRNTFSHIKSILEAVLVTFE
jgi:hypothetical protein